jgi:hypothetical protein
MKRRQVTVSAEDAAPRRSRARSDKPTNRAIDRRKSAAKARGGNALTPRKRKALEREGTERRTTRTAVRERTRTRAGTRTPEAGRYVRGAEARARRPSRKSDVPASDPGIRGVPATRITRNERRATARPGRRLPE